MQVFGRTALAVLLFAAGASARVELFGVSQDNHFAGATAPNAIRYACAPQPELAAYFAERGLTFDAVLVREHLGRPSCHIYYEPSLPGFRAATEDQPIQGLFAAAHPTAFHLRIRPVGDSLSIVKRILPHLERPLDIDLAINELYDPSYGEEALAYHFPDTRHRVRLAPTPGFETHPWAQDFIKAGAVGGEVKVLVPRRIYEGRQHDGDVHEPLLSSLQGDRYVRSKLAWDGGDLLFVKHPQDPSQRIVIYGASARTYWAQDLPVADYEWILKTEFGADLGFGLPDLSAHVDYVFSFLPDEPIAFVSQPHRGDAKIALAAVDALADIWGDAAPRSLGLLRAELNDFYLSPNSGADLNSLRRRILDLREKAVDLMPPADHALTQELNAWVSRTCPDRPLDCFQQLEKSRAMLAEAPGLARRTADFGAWNDIWSAVTPRLLSIIDGQLSQTPQWHDELIDAKARELRKLGFGIIRTPLLLAYEGQAAFPAVGYTNMLTIDDKIFMPTFELGKAEQDLIGDIEKKLDKRYRIIPIPARFSLLKNGGVHCVFGPIRAPDSAVLTEATAN